MFNLTEYTIDDINKHLKPFHIPYELFNDEYLYISGSFCLSIVDNDIIPNDIDIYIDSNIKIEKLKELIKTLINDYDYEIQFTLIYNYLNHLISTEYIKQHINEYKINKEFISDFEYPNEYEIKSDIKNMLDDNNDLIYHILNKIKNKDLSILTPSYCNIDKSLKTVLTLENNKYKKKIELIYIDGINIKEFINNTFDYNIVKNIIYKGNLYISNYDDIKNKQCKMTKEKFNKIFKNTYTFNHFIMRYHKYTNRKYNIYIDNIRITKTLFEIIINNILKYNNSLLNDRRCYNTSISYSIYNIENKRYSYNDIVKSINYIKILDNNILYNITGFHKKNKHYMSLYNKRTINNKELLKYKKKFKIGLYNMYEKIWNKSIIRIIVNTTLIHANVVEEIIKEVHNPSRVNNYIHKYGIESYFDNY